MQQSKNEPDRSDYGMIRTLLITIAVTFHLHGEQRTNECRGPARIPMW